jgi:hypothetical protein
MLIISLMGLATLGFVNPLPGTVTYAPLCVSQQNTVTLQHLCIQNASYLNVKCLYVSLIPQQYVNIYYT